jgi:hypothetical protein
VTWRVVHAAATQQGTVQPRQAAAASSSRGSSWPLRPWRLNISQGQTLPRRIPAKTAANKGATAAVPPAAAMTAATTSTRALRTRSTCRDRKERPQRPASASAHRTPAAARPTPFCFFGSQRPLRSGFGTHTEHAANHTSAWQSSSSVALSAQRTPRTGPYRRDSSASQQA